MKLIFCIFMIIFGCLCGDIEDVYAKQNEFVLEDMSSDEIESFLNDINIVRFTSEPRKEPIVCFDVDNNDMFAVGTENSENKKICIYSSDGVFQYGYQFQSFGSFGLEIKNGILNICFVRSAVSVAIDSEGNILKVSKISNTIENNSYWNYFVNAKKRKTGEHEYVLRNDIGFVGIFASSYSQLYRIDTDGQEKLLYDANEQQFIQIWAVFIGTIIFIIIVVYKLTKSFRHTSKRNKES